MKAEDAAGMPGVTVIIPTHESWPLVHRTLSAVVADCHAMGGSWEVIVVDNESGPRFLRSLDRFAHEVAGIRVVKRANLGGRPFQPGAARNIGIELARFDVLVFLDADCIPGPIAVSRYAALTAECHDTVLIGHRVFVDASYLSPDQVAHRRELIADQPAVASRSNYGKTEDRRMADLANLHGHPRPYGTLFGCNFALHRICLSDNRFDPRFDGHWGYEDLELGYRLYRGGCRFQYVPEAFVYHQEGGTESHIRQLDRRRNFIVACDLIPDFLNHPQVPPVVTDHQSVVGVGSPPGPGA